MKRPFLSLSLFATCLILAPTGFAAGAFQATLTGDSEVPPVETAGHGNVVVGGMLEGPTTFSDTYCSSVGSRGFDFGRAAWRRRKAAKKTSVTVTSKSQLAIPSPISGGRGSSRLTVSGSPTDAPVRVFHRDTVISSEPVC